MQTDHTRRGMGRYSLTCAVDGPDVTEECAQLDPAAPGGLERLVFDPANHIVYL